MKGPERPIERQKERISRRDFVRDAAAATLFTIVPQHVGHIPPSEKLNIAAIGSGGMGL